MARKIKITFKKEAILPHYRPYFRGDKDKKFNIYYGGVGSGKSYFLTQKFIYDCFKNPKTGVLIARKVQATLKTTVIATILEVLEDWGLDKVVHHQRDKNDQRFIFPNGSFILLKGYDNPEKLKGVPNITKIWMEEATDFFDDDMDALVSRIRGKNAKNIRIYLSFNPVWVGSWVRKRFFDEHNNPKDDETFILKSTYVNNPHYGDTSLLTNLQTVNPRRWKIDGLGEWGVLGELIYENWETISSIDEDHNYERIAYGLDFGFEHSTVLAKLGLRNNDIYVLDELAMPKLTVTELANQIKKRYPNNWQYLDIKADNARPEMIEELKQEGFYVNAVKKGAGSVLDGIEWIQSRKVYVYKQCKLTLFEKSGYQWQKDKKTGMYIPKPIKTQDDAMDAIRYGTEDFRTDNKIRFN